MNIEVIWKLHLCLLLLISLLTFSSTQAGQGTEESQACLLPSTSQQATQNCTRGDSAEPHSSIAIRGFPKQPISIWVSLIQK